MIGTDSVRSSSVAGSDGVTTWLTSDQHFRHGRLLELSPARGEAFPTVSDMNARLLHNWKAVVQPDDTVWVLGVVDMQRQGRRPRPGRAARRHQDPVSGNHDACWGGDARRLEEPHLAAGFAAVMDFAVTTLRPLRPHAPATRVLLSTLRTPRTPTVRTGTRSFGSGTRASRCSTATRTRRSGNVVRRRVRGPSTGGVDWWDFSPVSAETLPQHPEDLRRGRVEPTQRVAGDRALAVRGVAQAVRTG